MAVSKIKKIPPVPIALAVGLVNAILGLVLGILSAIGLGIVNDWVSNYAGLAGVTVPAFSGMTTALLIVAYPISGFIVGFLGTLLVIYVYNIVAKKVPIRVELK